MKAVVVQSVLLLVLCEVCVSSGPVDKPFKGLTFTDDKYCPKIAFDTPAALTSLKALATTGANAVAVVVTQYMKTHNSTTVFPLYTPVPSSYYTYVTASDASLRAVIQEAHALGLKVMLKPQVDLTEDPSYWRGQIGVGFNASQWSAWFDSYTQMLTHYTRMSEELGVEMVAVSTELIEASSQGDRWREAIAEVRKGYSGLVADAANWGYLNATGGEATNKTWWDAVDVIGIDAYYNLGLPANASLEERVEAYAPVVARLQNLSTYWDRPVMFSEIGFCSGGCKRDAPPATAEELENQALWYEAAIQAMAPHTWFHGWFWWAWSTDPGQGGLSDTCITPAFKPAQQVLAQYYGGNATAVPSSPPVPPTCLCTV